jgi:hypothetical protein
MDDQTAMMREQSESSKRQEGIAEKQSRIADQQHRIMEMQMARSAAVKIRIYGQEEYQSNQIILEIEAINEGTKTANGFYWEMAVDDAVQPSVKFLLPNRTEADTRYTVVRDEPRELRFTGLSGSSERLVPNSRVPVARVSVKCQNDATNDFKFYCRTGTDDGLCPAEGFSVIRCRRKNARFFDYEYVHDDTNPPES